MNVCWKNETTVNYASTSEVMLCVVKWTKKELFQFGSTMMY